MRNILKERFIKGQIVPTKFIFVIENHELIEFGVNIQKEDRELCENLFENLIECGLISFFEYVPDMIVSVEINDIIYNGVETQCIQTTHIKLVEGKCHKMERDCDCVISLSEFFDVKQNISIFQKSLLSPTLFSLN